MSAKISTKPMESKKITDKDVINSYISILCLLASVPNTFLQFDNFNIYFQTQENVKGHNIRTSVTLNLLTDYNEKAKTYRVKDLKTDIIEKARKLNDIQWIQFVINPSAGKGEPMTLELLYGLNNPLNKYAKIQAYCFQEGLLVREEYEKISALSYKVVHLAGSDCSFFHKLIGEYFTFNIKEDHIEIIEANGKPTIFTSTSIFNHVNTSCVGFSTEIPLRCFQEYLSYCGNGFVEILTSKSNEDFFDEEASTIYLVKSIGRKDIVLEISPKQEGKIEEEEEKDEEKPYKEGMEEEEVDEDEDEDNNEEDREDEEEEMS